MKVVQLNHADVNGGAARAAYRIHHAVRTAGVHSTMLVNLSESGDWTVEGPGSPLGRATARVRPYAASGFRAFLSTENPVIHSPAVIPSRWPRRLNASDADIIHMHWIAGETLSIRDVGRLNKPVVWTLHDMWAFCGAEHYTDDDRWQEGYRSDNRPEHESGFDLNRWTWRRKLKHWRRPMHVVTPSRWLADCVRDSALMRDLTVTVIANPIDTDRWKPIDQVQARSLLGLPTDASLLLFGALDGAGDPRKGFDLLLDALVHLHAGREELHLVVFGQLAPRYPPDLGFPIHYTGHLHDDLSLCVLYSAADLLVIPSRQEAFGQTASEAHACGTPVVAFNTGGLRDIVDHQHTGYLAHAYDTEELAAGIRWVIKESANYRLGRNARERAVKHFAYPVVAKKYRQVYAAAIKST